MFNAARVTRHASCACVIVKYVHGHNLANKLLTLRGIFDAQRGFDAPHVRVHGERVFRKQVAQRRLGVGEKLRGMRALLIRRCRRFSGHTLPKQQSVQVRVRVIACVCACVAL